MTSRATSPLVLALALAACNGGDAGTDTDTDTDGAPALTNHPDAKAVLDAKCAGCHRPGDIAPFALDTYAAASAIAPALPAAIEARTMPPWSPDNACRAYAHDRSLSDAERQLLLDWIALGAPEGDPADAPAPPAPPPPIDYDIELALPVAYTPTIAPDEYRCFLLPWPEDQDSFVTAFAVTPDSRQIVHHVIAYVIPPAAVPDYQALDDADPDPGYLCYGGPGGPGSGASSAWLGAWVPGQAGGEMPAGTGVHVAPGSMIAVQMHYHSCPGAPPDRSMIQVRTAQAVEREAVVLPFTNPKWIQGTEPMLIPAGDAEVVHTFEADPANFLAFLFPDGPFRPGEPIVVHQAGLHMHTLGTRASIRAVGAADTCVLDLPRWDFNWQGNYELAEPAVLQPGDKLRLECQWDNSAANQPVLDGAPLAPQDVLWGEGTGDEMCLGILYVAPA